RSVAAFLGESRQQRRLEGLPLGRNPASIYTTPSLIRGRRRDWRRRYGPGVSAATDTSGRPQDSHRVALSAALEGTTSHESELELWEKGDFTRIAASMGENGEAVVAGLGITPGLKVLDGPGPLMRRRDDGPAGGQTGRRRPRCRYREKSCRSREHSP